MIHSTQCTTVVIVVHTLALSVLYGTELSWCVVCVCAAAVLRTAVLQQTAAVNIYHQISCSDYYSYSRASVSIVIDDSVT